MNQNTQKKSWGPEETCGHSDSNERPAADTDVKISQRLK